MKMAKASEADLKMAMELISALESLMDYGTMPSDAASDDPDEFDIDSPHDCHRALQELFDIAKRGSLMRVVWGMAVLLDPENEIVDPASDVLERHPKYAAAPDLLESLREMTALAEKLTIVPDVDVFMGFVDALGKSRDAIAKATGGAA